jgi:hypothetical protein
MALIAPQVSNARPVKDELQVLCDKTEIMFKKLRDDFNEEPVIKAETAPGITMSLWLKADHSTYSVILTQGKLSCLINAGKDVEFSKKLKEEFNL